MSAGTVRDHDECDTALGLEVLSHNGKLLSLMFFNREVGRGAQLISF